MTDSGTGDLNRQYRRMLLKLEPQQRLAMAARMFSAAVAIARAGLGQDVTHQDLSIRQRLFLRLYGNDFSAADRDRILAYLADRPSA